MINSTFIPQLRDSQPLSELSPFPSQYTIMLRMRCKHLVFFLITEFDNHKFQPFQVEVTFGQTDHTNFCFLQHKMRNLYALFISSEGDMERIDIKRLTYALKKQELTLFLFVPCAHNILLGFFATTHSLPKRERGSIDLLIVLKGCHPL